MGSFEIVGPMVTARQSPVAISLPDGRVLVVSRAPSSSPHTQDIPTAGGTELFDTSTSAFYALPPLASGRAVPSLSPLPDGSILLVGGLDPKEAPPGFAEVSRVLERYDPERGAYEILPCKLTHARVGHQAISLEDGRTLILGGKDRRGAPIPVAEIYDPAKKTCKVAGSLLHPRTDDFLALRLKDGRVLVAGGPDGMAEAEAFDPDDGQFRPLPNMGVGRENPTAVLLKDGKVLIAGGGRKVGSQWIYESSAELFLPEKDVFVSTSGLMGSPRHGAAGVLLSDGRILIAGGWDSNRPLNTTEWFEPGSGTFLPGPKLHRGYLGIQAAALPGDRVLILGDGCEWAERLH